MDTTVPDITFDDNGFCNYCRQFEIKARMLNETSERKSRRLEALISRIKHAGKNNDYDCIIGVSGGVDSTYVALLTKEFGLRPLAVHLDNGWDSELAVFNIEKALRTLDIDLFTYVIDWEEFKDLQRAFLMASVTNIEVPTDHAITAILYRKAAEEHIKYLVMGTNLATEGINPSNWGEYNKDLRLIKGIHRRFGNGKITTFPTISLIQFAYYIGIKWIRHISLLNYVHYDRNEAMQELKEKLDWTSYGGKHYESVFTRFYQGYILPKKFGVDKRLGHLSTLIMSGQMTRAQAIEQMRLPLYPKESMEEDKEYCLKKLDLSEREFDELMARPMRSNKDYPSNYWIFRRLSIIMKMAKAIAKE